MATFQQPPPYSFKAEEWEEYIATFQSFRICSKLYKEPDEEQIMALKYTMGNTEAEKVAKTFKFEGTFRAPKKDNRTQTEERDQKAGDFDCNV